MANRCVALFAIADRMPEKLAIRFLGQDISFAELASRVRAAAGGLAYFGIGRGTRVGLLLPSGVDFIVLQQAIWALGAIVVPLNVLYRDGEIRHAAQGCVLDHLITDTAHEASLRTAVPPLPCTILAAETTVVHAIGASEPLAELAAVDAGAPAMLLLTSATTGRAKAVMLSAANLAANYDRTPGWLGLDGDTVTLCALPLYNTFGLNQGINVMTSIGATLVLLPRFDAGACLDAIARHGCSFLPAVPTMLQKILDHPGCTAQALAPLGRILTGGAPVPAALLQRLSLLAPHVVVMTGYGLTEATALVTLDTVRLAPDGAIARGRTIGRVLDGMRIAIADDAGGHLAPMQSGEIILSGPNIMQGYLNAPADTAAALSGGWLHTGDIGYLDEEGYAYIVDRKKDVIIRGGQNLYPAEIEEVLYQVAGVAEAAVVGCQDAMLGEVPVAYLVASPGAFIDVDQALAHCRAQLASFKVPAAIHLLAELPKGPTGKILRRALRGSGP